eukprot:m.250773 g.250773  ORF g.250773 m.250773 type:complete len:1198 (+) comp33888_c1_seq4:218-3811(+)
MANLGLWLFGVCVLTFGSSSGCYFDCRYDENSPEIPEFVCDGPPPEIVTSTVTQLVEVPNSNAGQFSYGEFAPVGSSFLSVDLTGRGIRNIAEGGLSCFDFVPYVRNDQENMQLHLRGILLGQNLLQLLPNMSTLDLLNASYISVVQNSLSKFEGDSGAVFDGMLSTQITILLDDNQFTYLPSGILKAFQVTELLGLSFANNIITSLPTVFGDGASSSALSSVIIILDNNIITALPESPFNQSESSLTEFVLSLNENRILVFPANFFQGNFYFYAMILFVKNNKMATIPEAMFRLSNSVELAIIILDNNDITSIPPWFFNGTNNMDTVTVSLKNNQVAFLPESLFKPIQEVSKVNLYLDNNAIIEAAPVFRGWNTVSTVTLSLQDNYVTEESFASILQSYTNCTGPLTLDLSGNQVNTIVNYVFAGVGASIIASFSYPVISINLSRQKYSIASFPGYTFEMRNSPLILLPVRASTILLNLSGNPNLSVDDEFEFYQDQSGQTVQALTIDLSFTGQTSLLLENFADFGNSLNPINTLTLCLASNNIQLNTNNRYESEEEFNPYVTIALDISNNSITSVPMFSFNDFKGTLDLSFNNITRLIDRSFFGTHLHSINLSNNQLVEVEPNTFHISVYLVKLDLSYNLLSNVTANFTDNTPVLQSLIVRGNRVRSAPLLIGNSRIFEASNAEGNILQCQVYSPQLQNCTCKGDLVFNEFCGYGRCTPTITGCATDGELPIDDCSAAPRSICVSECSSGYLSSSNALGGNKIATCIPYTNCSTTFGKHTQGYEFQAATRTSNRVCSACSVCSAGFDSSPCTATSNTVCTRTLQLTIGDISAIVVTVILVFVGTAGGTSYFFMRKKEEKKEHELELSQMLLGEVNEENSRMRKAWEICEDDLHIEKKLASGSFGVVWSATWGHIPVAVKTLHAHLAEFPSEMVEFERETIFMQSIRHPNLLIFYGAGIKTNGTPFLVVELMDKGSMGKLIKSESLPWSTRRRFALEVAQGMAHLHSLDSLHRDLKSDNCLVDDKLHVKVGDFGNSRLMSAYYGDEVQRNTYVVESRRVSDRSDRFKSLTSEVGTLLWMAPELLIGGNKAYGKEVDMFSFGIVMWELLTMEFPWENHFNDAPALIVIRRELTQMLMSGKRPTLPEYSNDTDYAPYIALMKRCWATQADTRPPFASVAALLADLAGCEIGCLRAHCD